MCSGGDGWKTEEKIPVYPGCYSPSISDKNAVGWEDGHAEETGPGLKHMTELGLVLYPEWIKSNYPINNRHVSLDFIHKDLIQKDKLNKGLGNKPKEFLFNLKLGTIDTTSGININSLEFLTNGQVKFSSFMDGIFKGTIDLDLFGPFKAFMHPHMNAYKEHLKIQNLANPTKSKKTRSGARTPKKVADGKDGDDGGEKPDGAKVTAAKKKAKRAKEGDESGSNDDESGSDDDGSGSDDDRSSSYAESEDSEEPVVFLTVAESKEYMKECRKLFDPSTIHKHNTAKILEACAFGVANGLFAGVSFNNDKMEQMYMQGKMIGVDAGYFETVARKMATDKGLLHLKVGEEKAKQAVAQAQQQNERLAALNSKNTPDAERRRDRLSAFAVALDKSKKRKRKANDGACGEEAAKRAKSEVSFQRAVEMKTWFHS